MDRSSRHRRTRVLGLTSILLLTACTQPNEVSVHDYVDLAIARLDEGYYADSAVWDAAVAEARPKLYAEASISGTYRALDRLTKIAGGKHSRFSRPAEIAAWDSMYESSGVPLPSVDYANMVGTVTLPAFSSEDPAEINQYLGALADALRSERGRAACGWVVDLSDNSGGSIWVMLAAMTPLLDDGIVERFRTRDGSVSEVWVNGNTVTWDGQDRESLPGGLIKLPDRPVAVVQSVMTASAAESVVLAFAGQDGAETFGTATGGFTTVNRGHELPDGAVITLSFALMGDRDGNFQDGPLAPLHDIDRTSSSAVGVAQSWAGEQCR